MCSNASVVLHVNPCKKKKNREKKSCKCGCDRFARLFGAVGEMNQAHVFPRAFWAETSGKHEGIWKIVSLSLSCNPSSSLRVSSGVHLSLISQRESFDSLSEITGGTNFHFKLVKAEFGRVCRRTSLAAHQNNIKHEQQIRLQ